MTSEPVHPAHRCSAATIRHAVYFAPERESPWWQFGASWLGRDEFLDRPMAQPVWSGRSAADLSALTAEPRRYGFHATLKAPFRLAGRHSGEGLLRRVEALAARQHGIALGRLEPAWIDGFVALVPATASPALQSLAAACVTELDDLRAPADAAERERRRCPPGDTRGQELVERFGYPHVLERFRFHMTLTGPVGAEAAHEILSRLAGPVVHLNAQAPLVLDRLCLFRQPSPQSCFQRVADIALAPSPGP